MLKNMFRSIRSTPLLKRYVSNAYHHPPTHFSDPHMVPRPYNNENPLSQISATIDNSISPPTTPPTSHTFNSDQSSDRNNSIKEITSLIAVFVLAYLATDNYVNRIKLESLNKETAAITQRSLKIQQTNFLNARKERDLQIIQERRANARRNFKMSLHIALLRKQLSDLGVEPKDIDTAIKEFEEKVRADNSQKNVSGQALWLDDSSPLKLYLPDAHDYDRKDK